MRAKISFGDLFKKSICYLLIFQIIAIDIVRASASKTADDEDPARPLLGGVHNSYSSSAPVSPSPSGGDMASTSAGAFATSSSSSVSSSLAGGHSTEMRGDAEAIDIDHHMRGSIQSEDEERGDLARNAGENLFENEIKEEIRRRYHQKIHAKITPTSVVVFALATVLGIGALQALEALTASGAFDLLHIPPPESGAFGAFYASTAAVHFVMFSEFIPFTYSSITGVSSIKEIILEGYEGITDILKKAIRYLKKQPQGQQNPQPWRSKHWNLLVLEIFNLISSTVYSLILVGILKNVEHKYPLFYKIFGPPLGITTFLDKITTGHKKAIKTSRLINREEKETAKIRGNLILAILKAKQYLANMDDQTLISRYRVIFPGYLRVLPMATDIPGENVINPNNLDVNDFDFDVLPILFVQSHSQQIKHSRVPHMLSGSLAVLAWYAICSVMFQSLESFKGYHWILYPLSVIAGTCIPYVEYDDVKELFVKFKEKALNWGGNYKRKILIASQMLLVLLPMFISFIYNYSEFKEVHNPDEKKHGFIAPLNNDKIFNWIMSVPLFVFEILSFTALQYAAYGAFKFLIKSFSKWSITEVSSYRERLMKLMDSFMEVVEEVSAEGLKTMKTLVPLPEQARA